MSETSAAQKPHLSLVQQADRTPHPFIVPVELSLSQEDKMILYAVLQDLANELRRITHEHEKHNQKREPIH